MLKKITAMKRVLLILLAPLLMSTQCEDDFVDSGFETTYLIQNDTNDDLFLLENGQFTTIVARTLVPIASDLNPDTEPIRPSQTVALTHIKLYRSQGGDFILVYQQDPINDESWDFEEPESNRFEYTLTITDTVIDGG